MAKAEDAWTRACRMYPRLPADLVADWESKWPDCARRDPRSGLLFTVIVMEAKAAGRPLRPTHKQ